MFVGGGMAINRLVGAAACCVWGVVWGWHCWWWGESGLGLEKTAYIYA